jgi:DNA-binding transcriptional regulator LsrR (DeoR family)
MKTNKLKRIDKFTRKYVSEVLSISSQNVNNLINSLKSKNYINEFLELTPTLNLTSNEVTLSIHIKYEKPNA